MKMENQIVCPQCKKVYTNNQIVDTAAKGEGGTNTASIMCECGERITYWQISAQLRNQKTYGSRFQNWFRNLFHSRG